MNYYMNDYMKDKYNHKQRSLYTKRMMADLRSAGSFLAIVSLGLMYLVIDFHKYTKYLNSISLILGVISGIIYVLFMGPGIPARVGARFTDELQNMPNEYEKKLNTTILHLRNKALVITIALMYSATVLYTAFANGVYPHFSIESLIGFSFTLLGVGSCAMSTQYLQVWWSIGKEIKMHKK